MREFGRISESSEKSKSNIETSLIEEADRINQLLDSIELDEIDRNKMYGIDQEYIRKTEKKEIKYDDLKDRYLKEVKKLALEKMKNDILFEGKLNSIIRNLTSLGLNITRESFLRDIEKEIRNQQLDFGSSSISYSNSNVDKELEALKSNLGNIFESSPQLVQEQKPVFQTISKAPSKKPAFGVQSSRETSLEQSKETKELQEQLKKAQEELAKKIEWARQQPNQPKFATINNNKPESLPEWAKDKGTSGYSNLNTEHQEHDFDKMYDLEIKKLVQLKQNNNPNYEVELANTIRKLSTLTNKIPNIRAQIESDINYELNKQNQIKSNQPFKQEQQTKDEIISKIINNMNMAGEFSFGDMSISERIDIMQNVKNKLNSKSMEELQILLSSYQYNQEQTQKHATRR